MFFTATFYVWAYEDKGIPNKVINFWFVNKYILKNFECPFMN